MIQAPQQEFRLHPSFLHVPSTCRLSCVDPNLQNVISGDEDDWVSNGFRKAIQPAPGHVFIEADFSAIEAVITGWYCGDPDYIRLAWSGIHDYLVAVEVGNAPPKSKLREYTVKQLKEILKPSKKHPSRHRKKRTVYGRSYGLTSYGLVKLDPVNFPKLAVAEREIAAFDAVAPAVPKWQQQTRLKAQRQHYLGGSDHPFKFKHWFWDVMTRDVNGWKHGSDFNRVVAYYPQSTAAGIIFESALKMMDMQHPSNLWGYYYGGALGDSLLTPIRALIHDSVLLEVLENSKDEVIERVVKIMTEPVVQMPCPPEWGIGEHLTVGVAVKVGKNWKDMEEVYST